MILWTSKGVPEKNVECRVSDTHLTQARDGQRFIRLFLLDPPEAGETRAVEAANRTLYGLTSSILAGDTYKAFELAPKILAGPSSTSTRRR